MVGQRHILIHDYGRVDPLLIWNLTRTHVPLLVSQIEPLVPRTQEEE